MSAKPRAEGANSARWRQGKIKAKCALSVCNYLAYVVAEVVEEEEEK